MNIHIINWCQQIPLKKKLACFLNWSAPQQNPVQKGLSLDHISMSFVCGQVVNAAELYLYHVNFGSIYYFWHFIQESSIISDKLAPTNRVGEICNDD
jgi:hypothetical protein